MSASKLKRCKVCGRNDVKIEQGVYGLYNAICLSCHTKGPCSPYMNEAIAAWNRRAGEGEK